MENKLIDLEAEQATLGAMLLDRGALVRGLALTSAEDYYYSAHRGIFEAMRDVHAARQAVDLVSVGHMLKQRGLLEQVGGGPYLTALLDRVPTVAHVVRYGTIVSDLATRRRLVAAAEEIRMRTETSGEEADALLSFAARRVREVGDKWRRCSGAVPIGSGAEQLRERLRKRLLEPPHVTTARTGIDGFDRKLGGLGRHNLIVARAPTKGYKSMLAMQCALATACALREAGDDQRVVVCYVLEALEVWEERMVAWLGGFSSGAFEPWSSATLAEQAGLESAIRSLRDLPLLLSGRLREVEAIEGDLQTIACDSGIALVVIDHAQLLRGCAWMGDSLTVQAEEKAVRLANLSAELGCPIIVPSQVTKADGERRTKWARAWEENASLVFDIEREGRDRAEQQGSCTGEFVLHACRRRAAFTRWPFVVDPSTGHFRDGEISW